MMSQSLLKFGWIGMINYENHTEEHLLTLLGRDDELAFTEIYNRYWKKLYATAYERLKSKELAEDVVHEVFTSLWQRRHEAVIKSLNAYLAAATRYCTLKLFSGFSKADNPVEEMALPDHSTGQAFIDFRFLEQMLQQEVNRLPEKCRLVFRYSRQEQMTNNEIARELGISSKAVEKHITRAIKQLSVSLKSFFHLFL
jgi:RNA polymerase sigma factor, sigma-70 family